MSWSLMGVSRLTGTVLLFLNSQTIKQHTLYIFQMTNFKKIHDILWSTFNLVIQKKSQSPSPMKNLPTSAKHKITIHIQYIIPANLACYMVYAISCTSRDNTRAVFLRTLATCAKILHLSII